MGLFGGQIFLGVLRHQESVYPQLLHVLLDDHLHRNLQLDLTVLIVIGAGPRQTAHSGLQGSLKTFRLVIGIRTVIWALLELRRVVFMRSNQLRASKETALL